MSIHNFNIDDTSMHLSTSVLPSVTEINDLGRLGVLIDDKLSFTSHINRIVLAQHRDTASYMPQIQPYLTQLTLGQRTEFCNANRGVFGKVATPIISDVRRDRNIIPASTRMFSGVNFSMAPSETPEVRNSTRRLKKRN